MPTPNISKKVAEPKSQAPAQAATQTAPSLASLDSQTQEVMDRLRAIEEAEKRVVEQALPEGKEYMVEKSVRIDKHNLRRFLVELTPTMCQKENCNYDASTQAGYKGGYSEAEPHLNLVLPDGRTIEEALTKLLDFHKRTAHRMNDSHILTKEEAQARKRLSGVPGHFLTAAGS